MLKKILFLCILLPLYVMANEIDINWSTDIYIMVGEDSVQVMSFEGADYIDGSFLPYYTLSQKLEDEEALNYEYKVSINNVSYKEIEPTAFYNSSYIKNDFNLISNVTSSNKNYSLEILILPFKKDNEKLYALSSFALEIEKVPSLKIKSESSWFNENSLFSEGYWMQVGVKESGIYKLTYSQLIDMGIDPSAVSIFATQPGHLSKLIEDYSDGLQEIAIFDGGDYILFYGESPSTWTFDEETVFFNYNLHPYWNENYYYVTSDFGVQKRISLSPTPTKESTLTYTTFRDYDSFTPEIENIDDSGDDWYSEPFSNGESLSHTFEFDNVILENAKMSMGLAARSSNEYHYMLTYIDGYSKGSVSLELTPNTSTSMAAYETTKLYDFVPTSNEVEAKMSFVCSEASALTWVDHFTVNLTRDLLMSDNQLAFRNLPTDDEVVNYVLRNTLDSTIIWDVTNRYEVKNISSIYEDGSSSFKIESTELKEFIAVNSVDEVPSPIIIGEIENQNIHGMTVPDMVILCPSEFSTAADNLAELHRNDGLTVLVLNQEEVFNEFSGGKADITAIRWMLKMFYDKSTAEESLQYFLLFGDGDVNNRMFETDDCALLMSYESEESLNRSESYVSDDYFGLLDDSEGNGRNIELVDKVDIGIGRIPVTSLDEANDVVNKIDHYMNHSKQDDWSNSVCFIADDEDKNTHINDADEIADLVHDSNPEICLKKVFMDAFVQKDIGSGDRYPDANTLSNKYISDGLLIWSYAGHGSPYILADEIIMTSQQINSFENIDNLPLWLTATCDFCPYDHNKKVSAGERVLLNPDGGGIALFTTTRLVYSSSNKTITKNFYKNIFESNPETKEMWRLGDVCRLTKGLTGTGSNKRKFTFIGDPALKLHMANNNWNIATETINGIEATSFTDTLKALSNVSISAYVEHVDDFTVDTTFNGIVYTTVYDKINTPSTLANDANSSVTEFDLWNSILYKGAVDVVNGRFTVNFILPKDMNYTVGMGRVEYYALSDNMHVNGYFNQFKIGSVDEDIVYDTEGPIVEAYMENTSFVSGGIVTTSPTLLATISDPSGIASTGYSIGHDITLKLSDDDSEYIVLNDNFTVKSDDFTTGTLSYTIDDLEVGTYTAYIKVWDTQNNSTTEAITFEVKDDAFPGLYAVYSNPNPVSISSNENIRFITEYTFQNTSIDVSLEVLNDAGKIMYSTSSYSYSPSNELFFDWLPSFNTPPGLYFYRICIKDGDQIFYSKSKKITINQ